MYSDKQNKIAEAFDAMAQLPEQVRFQSAAVWAGLEGTLRSRRQRKALRAFACVAILILAMLVSGIGYYQANRSLALVGKLNPAHTAFKPLPLKKADSFSEIKSAGYFAVKAQKSKNISAHDTVVLQQPSLTLVGTKLPDTIAKAASVPVVANVPARSRFRIGHINEDPLSIPATINLPPDEKGSFSFLHLYENGSGPQIETTTAEQAPQQRRPRTMMSLLKPHQ
jgi:hypothetical protein